MIEIANDGPLIVDTNYWDSDYAERGLFYLSWNAGTGRLLIPDNRLTMLSEMQTGKYVVLSRGFWNDAGTDGLELMFEDNSDSPFCLHLSAAQTDRLLPETNQGGGFEIVAYSKIALSYKWPGKYRRVEKIPCLEPWATH